MALRLPVSVRVTAVLERPDLALVVCERRVAGTGPDGEPVRLTGHGCAVLRSQPDGMWRIVADAWQTRARSFPLSLPRFPRRPDVMLLARDGRAASPLTATMLARTGHDDDEEDFIAPGSQRPPPRRARSR